MTTSLGPLATNPATIIQGSAEEIPWGVDMTLALTNVAGGSVSDVEVSLVDRTSGKVIELANTASVTGNVVTQIIVGSQLTVSHNYTLTITFAAATDTTLSTITTVLVPA